MKKMAIALAVYLACASFSHAATSPLVESLLEYEAITSAIGSDPNFQNVISPSEFIIDIDRITRKTDVIGTVKYEIVTRLPRADDHRHRRTHVYKAVLNVSPNPGIGPNIITVLSITPCHND